MCDKTLIRSIIPNTISPIPIKIKKMIQSSVLAIRLYRLRSQVRASSPPCNMRTKGFREIVKPLTFVHYLLLAKQFQTIIEQERINKAVVCK